jgi:hypothetical protein
MLGVELDQGETFAYEIDIKYRTKQVINRVALFITFKYVHSMSVRLPGKRHTWFSTV